ncbi:MAG: hypothetical protein RMY36_026675 [Nostoc sp. SerVER01]
MHELLTVASEAIVADISFFVAPTYDRKLGVEYGKTLSQFIGLTQKLSETLISLCPTLREATSCLCVLCGSLFHDFA